MNKYKLLLIGDGGVGKTTFLNRHLTGEYNKERTIHPNDFYNVSLNFDTNYGKIMFDVYETNHYIKLDNVDAIFMMFDTTSTQSLTSINTLFNMLSNDYDMDKIPYIICGNKVDIKNRMVLPQDIRMMNEIVGNTYSNCPTCNCSCNFSVLTRYYDISARSSYNFEKPFLKLAKLLLGKDDLRFTEMFCEPPPAVQI